MWPAGAVSQVRTRGSPRASTSERTHGSSQGCPPTCGPGRALTQAVPSGLPEMAAFEAHCFIPLFNIMEQRNSTHQRRKYPGVLNLFSRQNGKWRVVKFGPGSWLWALPGSLSGGPCCGPRFSRAGPGPGLPWTWLSEGRRVIPHQDWARALGPEFPEGSQSTSISCPPGPLPSDICAGKPTAPEPPPPG